MQDREISFRDKINFALFMAELPALTVMVFLRKRIGYRTLSPWRFVLTTAGLLLIANPFSEFAFSFAETSASFQPFPAHAQDYVSYPASQPPLSSQYPLNSGLLGIFGMLALVFASAQRTARWKDIRKGVRWHTYHRGISHFAFRPSLDGVAERWIDPVVSVILGLLAWRFLSPALGAWLVLSGISLRLLEFTIYRRNLEQNLDILDASVDGQTVDEVVQHFEQHPASRTFSNENVEVIHTRLAPDVEALIARRKKKQEPPKQ